MKTINRIHAVCARLKLKKGSYARRTAFVVLTSVLLISFQNCSQGKFEIDQGQVSNSSLLGANSGAGTGAGGAPPPPPPSDATGENPSGEIGPTAAQLQAEKDRKARCRSAIKAPVITNTADYNAKVVNIKSGLGTDAGDVSIANTARPFVINVDASRGVDSAKFMAGDLCTFNTLIVAEVISEAGRDAVLNQGIDMNGNALVVQDVNGSRAVNHLANAIARNSSEGNNDQDLAPASTTISFNWQIRQANQNNPRLNRCVDGSVYVRFTPRVQTTGLNTVKPGYPQNDNNNPQVSGTPVYARIDIENNCWKEKNLTKIIPGTSTPATNAKLGTGAVIDGDWAASISAKEGNTGFLYIFRKVNGEWSFFQKFKGQNGNGTSLTGLALRNGVLAVASAGDGIGYPGRVFLYALDGNQLSTYTQILDNPVGGASKFGASVAISGNANSIVIGSPVGANAVYLYNLNNGLYGAGSTSTRAPSDTFNSPAIDVVNFGANVVCQSGRLFVAAYDGNGGYAGSVYMFDISSGSFGSVLKTYTAPTGFTSKGLFGYAIAYNGSKLAIGGYDNETGGTATGAIAYYKDIDATAHVVRGNAAEERFGVTLGFYGDSLYVGSRGGAGTPGTISRYKTTGLDSAGNYGSRVFAQRSHDQSNGEGFSFSMGFLNGASVPTVIASAQTKAFDAGAGDVRANAGAVYIYEVK